MAIIQVYNTLTQEKEEFKPRLAGEASIYVCGVTPYAEAHIGHARPSVIWDVIKRFLRWRGYQVLHVQNFTDVDDKIIEEAQKEGVSALSVANRYIPGYLQDMDALGVERADFYPRVSDHIQEVIDLVSILIEKGYAYETKGDVFFHVPAFPEYGKLSKQKREELLEGTRFEVDPNKRDAADFALWKKAKGEEPAWESPWGLGRPGWHIECSAMSYKYLGKEFDFHGGGSDLIFPHHENEIAQSEAATGAPLARYWVHNGMINFKDAKMSKSIGNVVSVVHLLQRYPRGLIRYYLLSTHYRSSLDYYEGRVQEMQRGWGRLNDTVFRLKEALENGGQAEKEAAGDGQSLQQIEKAYQGLIEALADDFNTAKALGILFELVRQVNSYLQREKKSLPVLRRAWEVFQVFAIDILGVVALEEGQAAGPGLVGPLMDLLLELRQELRQTKNYALADRIRLRLNELGIALEDTAQGTRWKV